MVRATLGWKQKYLLFILCRYYEKLNQISETKPIRYVISKSGFIKFLNDLNLDKTTKQTIYAELKSLEDKGLIKYDNKIIEITDKGFRKYRKLFKSLERYFNAIITLENLNIKEHSKYLKAILRLIS